MCSSHMFDFHHLVLVGPSFWGQTQFCTLLAIINLRHLATSESYCIKLLLCHLINRFVRAGWLHNGGQCDSCNCLVERQHDGTMPINAVGPGPNPRMSYNALWKRLEGDLPPMTASAPRHPKAEAPVKRQLCRRRRTNFSEAQRPFKNRRAPPLATSSQGA